MPSFHFRRPLALASVLAVGATTFVADTTAANASLPGSGSVLTSSNSSTTIKFSGDPSRTSLTSLDTVTDAAWAPDGSQALYVDGAGAIAKLRFNDGQNIWPVTDPYPAAERHSPSWRGDGSTVVWAERPSATALWHIELGSSTYGWPSREISPADGKHYLNPDGGPDLRVVYQVQADDGGKPIGTPEIGLYDPAKPAADRFAIITADAANPAISPDGTKVAFVRSDGSNNNQIWVSDFQGADAVQVTENAANHDNPTWSPDGKTIAFSQSRGVATAPADGSGKASPMVVSGLDGVPGYQPRNKDRVARLAGSSRFTTATAVSQSHWASAANSADTREKAGAVVLSRSDTFADALGGSALAAAKRGPLLMTPTTSLEASTGAEIQRVLAPGGKVYLLGSTGALSDAVKGQIEALGYTTERIAGSDRFATSVAIAKAIDPTPDLVLAATGMNFPDALAAGAAAGSFDTPGSGSSAVVVLTNDSVMPASTKSFLDTLTFTPEKPLFGIGRYAAAAASAYTPYTAEVWGENRYETALYTAWTFFAGQNYIGIATGSNWPDALSGGALMGLLNGPLMLTPGTATTLGFEAEILLDENCGSTHTGLIFGSAAVVNDTQRNEIGSWISGPLGYNVFLNPTDVGTAAISATESARIMSADGTSASTAEETSTLRTPAEAAKVTESLRDRLAQAR